MDDKDVTADTTRQGSLDNVPIDDKKSVSLRDLDETYEVYKRQDARNIDPQEAQRVLRKVDLHILPLLMGTYMLQYLDKSSINFASVFGLEDGTHLKGQDYSWYVEQSSSRRKSLTQSCEGCPRSSTSDILLHNTRQVTCCDAYQLVA